MIHVEKQEVNKISGKIVKQTFSAFSFVRADYDGPLDGNPGMVTYTLPDGSKESIDGTYQDYYNAAQRLSLPHALISAVKKTEV